MNIVTRFAHDRRFRAILFLTAVLFVLVVFSVVFLRIRMAGALQSGAVHPDKQAKEEVSLGFIGEKIIYDVKLGGIHLGEAEFNHLKRVMFNGKLVNLMTFQTRMMRFNDLEMIYCDIESFLPLKIERDVRLWPNQEKITEEYNQENFTLTITKYKGKNKEEQVIRKDGVIHNAILLPYSVRHLPQLAVGWTLPVRLPTQQFSITLVSLEDVTVPAGTFRSYHFESVPKKIEIWITADERRIPVKLTGSGVLGYTLVMKEYKR